ncbi:MAG: hypothetical protein GEU90_18755 [Gemmatimonas sp.]|nr:hypothetical protein [Gemmatimonas sp.]
MRAIPALAMAGVLAGCAGSGGDQVAEMVGQLEVPQAQVLDFAFYRENIEPIFIRPRGGFVGGEAPCASCHTFQTTTPLKLQPLQVDGTRAYWTEAQSRLNFQVVSRLVTPQDPDNSRLLRKPLAEDAGGVPDHTGGKFWESKDNPEWQIIAEWVRSAPTTVVVSEPVAPDFEFFRSCVQPIFVNPISNAVACAECHSGGGRMGFGQRPPEGRTTWTEEESRQSYEALIQFIEPGHPELSRFLHHPLAVGAGGDFMHNGGRRWASKSDGEWQALAAWIRGEARGGSCPAGMQFSAD